MMRAEIASQYHEYTSMLSAFAQQSKRAFCVLLLPVLHARHAEHMFDGLSQGVDASIHAGRADKRQWLDVVVIFKNSTHKALTRSEVAH